MIAEFDNGRLVEVVEVCGVSSNETCTLLAAAVLCGFCTNFVCALLHRLAVKLDDEGDEQWKQHTQEDLISQTT